MQSTEGKQCESEKMLDRLRGKDVLELCGIKVFDKSSLSHFPSHVQREATLFPLGSLAGALLCSG